MKDLLRKVFKGLLILTLLALVVLLVFGLVLLLGWTWWVGFFILVGLLGMALAVWVMRKLWIRRRERMFVHQVIEQDESIRRRMTPKEQDTAKELQDRWKEAIDALRHSHLRKYGNPLYVLPWYMIIGESGSGKTTAIQSAKLSSPFAQVSRTSGISGTRNCDWWFFEQAILIDTAGRYTMPVDAERDKDEWQKFLGLLAKFRKKEPLNGLVVTVAADRLLQASPETLHEEGRGVRQRIEELMRVLGAKFPVYILVTKCDLIQGAAQFCNALPEAALQQAMGELNQQLSPDVKAFTQKTIRTVGDRLRDLRLILLQKVKERSAASAMLLFPEEFERLRDPLSAFLEGAFQENRYMETPLLRGLYFSSGRQEGTPYSHFLTALGLVQAREVLSGTNKGLFLHDVFARILPADRNLFRPTQHMREWRQLTRNMGLTAWIAVMIAVCGLLSYAFVKNLSALSGVRREFQKTAVLQGDLMPDVITLERYREALLSAEEQNRNWWIPRLGLRESLEVETQLKKKYIGLFNSGLLRDFDKRMGERMTRFNSETANPVFGAHVMHLARRVNLLKARMGGQDLRQLGELPQPAYTSLLFERSELIPEIEGKISGQYLYAIAWQNDSEALNAELTHLQTWLKHLLTLPDRTLYWLADWANQDPTLAALGLHDFWGGEPAEGLPVVPSAFTQDGKTRIESALAEIEAALFDPLVIAAQKIDFAKWYPKAYFEAWDTFARTFAQGEKLLKKREQWQTVAKRLPTDQGPYYALIDQVTQQFDAFDQDVEIPPWVALAFEWRSIQEETKTKRSVDLGNAGLLKKATRSVQSKITRVERAFGVKMRPPMDEKARLGANQAHLTFQKALEEVVKAADSRNTAFKQASELYVQDEATGEAPLLSAHRALGELRVLMSGPKNEAEGLFWELMAGNLHFMLRYINQETACVLQDRWEKDVILELQGVGADTDVSQMAMGQGGVAAQFIKGPAEPFLTRSLAKGGYFPKPLLRQEIAFQKEFLAFLTKGSRAVARPVQSSYAVKIRAYPTGTNKDAQLRPHSTVLEFTCADNKMRLENLNYPVARTVNWSPQDCGDVTFQISVGNLLLTKTYSGQYAFAKFLHDFRTGQRTFERSEFPSDEAALRRLNISFINAKYQFEGHDAVLQLLYQEPGKPPQRIVPCWDR